LDWGEKSRRFEESGSFPSQHLSVDIDLI